MHSSVISRLEISSLAMKSFLQLSDTTSSAMTLCTLETVEGKPALACICVQLCDRIPLHLPDEILSPVEGSQKRDTKASSAANRPCMRVASNRVSKGPVIVERG